MNKAVEFSVSNELSTNNNLKRRKKLFALLALPWCWLAAVDGRTGN